MAVECRIRILIWVKCAARPGDAKHARLGSRAGRELWDELMTFEAVSVALPIGHEPSSAPAATARRADLAVEASAASVSSYSPHSGGCDTGTRAETRTACHEKKSVHSRGVAISASMVTRPRGQMVSRVKARSSPATGSNRLSLLGGGAPAIDDCSSSSFCGLAAVSSAI